MPPDPEEFLQQADALAGNSSATQVDLRRAISAAYYAVFHFCLAAGTDMILGAGASASARYSIVYRSVDHARLRGLCEQLKVEKTHKDLPMSLPVATARWRTSQDLPEVSTSNEFRPIMIPQKATLPLK